MSRVTWFVAGAATGVYGLVRARRAARTLTPDGIAARAAALNAGLRVFAGEVSAGMADREDELKHRLALPSVAPSLDAILPRHRREHSSPPEREDLVPDGHR